MAKHIGNQINVACFTVQIGAECASEPVSYTHLKRTILLDASGVSRACDLALGLENIVVLDMADVANRQAGIEAALYKAPRYENLRFACASLYDDVSIMELTSTLLDVYKRQSVHCAEIFSWNAPWS